MSNRTKPFEYISDSTSMEQDLCLLNVMLARVSENGSLVYDRRIIDDVAARLGGKYGSLGAVSPLDPPWVRIVTYRVLIWQDIARTTDSELKAL